MNERIKEFANSAYCRTEYDNGNVHECYEFSVDELEKFSELIVRECVRHFNEDYRRDFDTLWREDLSKSIKQHFGVE